MKYKKAPFIAAILMGALALISCVGSPAHPSPAQTYTPEPAAAATPVPTASPQAPGPMVRPVYDDTGRTRYEIDLTFDEKTHMAEARQHVTYVNTTVQELSSLYMHIYPKHFSKREYVSMEIFQPGMTVYPDNAFNPGDITLDSVRAAGQEADYTIQGEDETILHIPLPAPLKAGASIELDLAYGLSVPYRMGRYAWGETGTSFANWYPIMAVYDDTGWNLDPYYEIGDPFYSETADYTVTIDMPADMEAAYTGEVTDDTTSGDRRVLSLTGTGVRDFAFMLSDTYQIEEKTVDDVTVRTAIPPEGVDLADLVMETAGEALHTYNARFGRYIGDTLTVAFVDDYSGMEYPGIVFIGKDLLNTAKGPQNLQITIAHEIGHQWWYSAVGNDEIDEPWLDESLTSFSTLVYGRESGILPDYWQDIDEIQPQEGRVLEESLGEYEGWDDYEYIYSFGQFFFVKLMLLLGEDTFYPMMQQYYAEYAYGIARTGDLRDLVASTGNEEALSWFDRCVYGSDYRAYGLIVSTNSLPRPSSL